MSILRFFTRRKNENQEEEATASSPASAPEIPASRLEMPETFAPPANSPLAVPETPVHAETALHFPDELEFPEISSPYPQPEGYTPDEILIRRISWDERRFSQSMTEED
ncbi:MAG: hypothetical protein FWH00_00420 [Oscillospiraceae bacterium]|nr:hypothetical protein [Oscillospiraceae bacterium]